MRRRFYTSDDMFANYIKATYNITTTSSNVDLMGRTAASTIADMWLEKVSSTHGGSSLIQISPKHYYTFSTTGIYNVYIRLNDTTVISNYAFDSCDSLSEVVIPKGVTSIGDRAFVDCTSLSEVVIPKGVTSIGDRAFSYCESLSSVTLPSTLTSIGPSAFHTCGLLSINIPEGVTSIGKSAFSHCESLSSVTLPSTLTSIGETTFDHCASLFRVVIPKGVTSIGNQAFYYCTSLSEVLISEGVTSIGDDAFFYCKSLSEVLISEGVTSIGESAFSNCSSLTSVILPATLTSIGPGAFAVCTSLSEVVIYGSVTSLVDSVFEGCSGLTSIILPATLTSIGYYTFRDCTSLTSIISQATTAPTLDSYTFYNVKSGGTLTVPTGATGYNGWMQTGRYYLGFYNWRLAEGLYTVLACESLTITADDVGGIATQTTIYYTAKLRVVHLDGTEEVITETGSVLSDTFPQNTSPTNTVTRIISYTYMGVTATTTITQGVLVNDYTINLNNKWRKSTTISNPDSTLYDGVYESFSNKGAANTAAIMYIDIIGYTDFTLYVRSNAEYYGNDYVMVSQLDQDINNNTSYSNTTLVKAHTRRNQQAGTALSNYTAVNFTGIDRGTHRITIVYRKDGSGNSGDDRGYVLIPKP